MQPTLSRMLFISFIDASLNSPNGDTIPYFFFYWFVLNELVFESLGRAILVRELISLNTVLRWRGVDKAQS